MKKYLLIALLAVVSVGTGHAQFKSPAKPARVVVINKTDGTRDTLMMSDVDRITFGYSQDVIESPAEAEPVDMGLSVKWASFNLGATEETGRGFLVGWGDNTAVNESENPNFYPKKTPPASIVESDYDLAKVMWGGDWRLPTDAEFQELIDACEWTWSDEKQGYEAKAPNGQTLFFPVTSYRRGHAVVESDALKGYYWTGFLAQNTRQALAAKFDGEKPSIVGADRFLGLAIRPVQGEYVLPLTVSAALQGKAGFTDASIAETFTGNTAGVTAYGVAYQKYKAGQEFDFASAKKVEKTGTPAGEQEVLSLTGLDENTQYVVMAYAKVGENIVKAIETMSFTTDCRYVDLGLSVKWAKWNIGAESENEYGGYYGWGDPTGTLASPYDNHYAVGNTSTNISGNAKYDIATAQWGKHWRMPTQEEFQELLDASFGNWTYSTENGIQKYTVEFPNGETLVIPINGYMTGDLSELAHPSHGYYWTSNATSDQEPYALHISTGRSQSFQTSVKSLHVFVRPVYVDDAVDPDPSDDDPTDPETSEAGKAVDLGLWSGTLWANYNVGAKSETEAGMYVAWAELTEKKSEGYFKENYAFWSADNVDAKGNLIYGGYSTGPANYIAGTEYDLAHVRWKGDWKMPTEQQFEELKHDCTWTAETRKGVFGYKVTGPNGNSIFLPCRGHYNGMNLLDSNVQGNYWCEEMYRHGNGTYQTGYCLILVNGVEPAISWESRKSGCNIRPVKKKK